ncbi:MAG: Rrf2 family transcriptional regulator [Planctomycetota bacterium]
MAQCTRFPVLTHILVCLSVVPQEYLSSAMLAKSVDTNPAVIRRMLALLVGEGWVQTQAGVHGGARLVVDPQTISLRDVFRLAEHDTLFALHAPQKKCPIAGSVKEWITRVLGDAEEALEAVLAQTTIADIGVDAAADLEQWMAQRK